jgi:hypothetical protein
MMGGRHRDDGRDTLPRPVHEIPTHERLAEAVPIADLVTVARKRAASTFGRLDDPTASAGGDLC